MEVPGFGGKAVDFILRFEPEVRSVVEDQFSDVDLTLEEEGSVVASFSFPEDEWVYAMILSYGSMVEVLQPLHVREIIRDRAKKTALKYEPDREVS